MVGVGPQTTEIDALVYMWGEKILRLLANAALYLGHGTRMAYNYWMTYRKSQAIYLTVA